MRWLLVPLVLAQTTIYCSFKSGYPASPTGVGTSTLAIKVGVSATAAGVVVTFVGVINDSRCPIDVYCVHRGDTVARFHTSSRRGRDTVDVHLFEGRRSADLAGGYRLEFRALTPDPVSTRSIDPDAYVATVDITGR